MKKEDLFLILGVIATGLATVTTINVLHQIEAAAEDELLSSDALLRLPPEQTLAG